MTSKSTARERRLRHEFAERAAKVGAGLLATAIEAYARAEGMDWAQLAGEIDCDSVGLDRIACCRPPRPQEFAGDVENIARYAGADPDKLLSLLRKLDIIREFIDSDNVETGVQFSRDHLLLAARDREPDSEAASEAEVEDA